MDALIGWPGGDWQSTARLSATLIGGYMIVLWATSVLWVYRDIRSRTRDPVSQMTAVAISIVFPLVSLPIYAALRPPETLQDAYLRLLEREVLLSELGSIQQTEPRPPGGGGAPERSPVPPLAPAVLPPDGEPVASESRRAFDDAPQVPLRPEASRSISGGADGASLDFDDEELKAVTTDPTRRRSTRNASARRSGRASARDDDDDVRDYEDEPLRQRG